MTSTVRSTKTQRYEVERIDVPIQRPFPEACAALEEQAPKADVAAFVQMVTSGWDARRIEHAIEGMVGQLGLMTLGKLEQGPLVSVLGKPKKMSLYLIGNPVLANRMYDQRPAVGLYAPLRVLIYEDEEGTCHFTYERPSMVLEQFGDDEIRAVARLLDQKMEHLATRLEGGRRLEFC
jgi:uncharacterized protein (DUF302 family)